MESDDKYREDDCCGMVETFMLKRVKPKGNVMYDMHLEVIFVVPSHSGSNRIIAE